MSSWWFTVQTSSTLCFYSLSILLRPWSSWILIRNLGQIITFSLHYEDNRVNQATRFTRLNSAAINKVAPTTQFDWLVFVDVINCKLLRRDCCVRAAILLGLALVMRLKRVQNQLFCGKALKFFCLINNESFLTVINWSINKIFQKFLT